MRSPPEAQATELAVHYRRVCAHTTGVLVRQRKAPTAGLLDAVSERLTARSDASRAQ